MPVSLTGMVLARDGLVTATVFNKLWFDAFDGILVELAASVSIVGRTSMKPSRTDAEVEAPPSVASSLLGPATKVNRPPVPTLARAGERED